MVKKEEMKMWSFGGFILGAVVASLVWFFIWKNNKEKFEAMLADLESKVKQAENKAKEIITRVDPDQPGA